MTTRREKHIAVVTDNNDDEMRGRIKANCASLLGIDPESGEARELPMWIEPTFPQLIPDAEGNLSGFFGVPGVDATVEIEITASSDSDQSPDQASLAQLDPKYIACLINQGEKLSPDFKKNYPHRTGWRSKNGNFVIFDDKTDEIIVQHSDKKTKIVIGAGTIDVTGAMVNVGDGADSPIVRHKDWEKWAKPHVHPTVFGPSGAPVVPPTPNIASKKAKVR